MAEPVHSPIAPRSRGSRPLAAEAPEAAAVPAGLDKLLVQDLPELPSLAALLALTDRDLPSSDGLPMESDQQYDTMTYTVDALRQRFRRRPDVYVMGDVLVYDTGRPDAEGPVSPVWIGPDVLVAFGVENRKRRSYVIWQEGKPPDFVMEIASPSTSKRDREEKPRVYASLGVAEYFLFDPVGGLLEPRLQGRVLCDGAYRPLSSASLPNGEWGVYSEVLGLWAYPRGAEQELRWHDPATGKDLESFLEVHDARDVAEACARATEARAEAAEARARAAEDELAELRAQLRRSPRG